MSLSVDLTELTEALADFGFAYLLTVNDGGRPHAVAVTPEVTDGVLAVRDLGRRSVANTSARPHVSLLFPPREVGGYSLIVDGDAKVDGDTGAGDAGDGGAASPCRAGRGAAVGGLCRRLPPDRPRARLMRVGVILLPQGRWRDDAERWRRAEAYGFDHAWTYDHLSWRSLVDEPWFAAVPTLAAAALVTERIRLGTMVASPNFRHPVTFAKELMSLDDLSDGRFVLGVGAGGIGFDATVLGADPFTPGERFGRFEEFVVLLDQLLTQPSTTERGDRYAAVDARMIPGCVQQPRLPFVIAAIGRRSMRLAARHGQGWVTTGGTAGDREDWWGDVADLSPRFDTGARGSRPGE